MEKLQYLVWLPEGTPRSDVKPLMIDEVAPELLAQGILGLTIDLDDDDADVAPPVPPPEGENMPEQHSCRYGSTATTGAPDRRRSSATRSVRVDGYQVLESLYTDYGTSRVGCDRATGPTAADRRASSPSQRFEQPPGTDFEEWLSFWHGHQSPMSEAIQPRCRYVRNLVVRALEPGQAAMAGDRRGGLAERRATSPIPCSSTARAGTPRVMSANITTMLDHVTRLTDLQHLAEHDHERVDHEDGGVLMGRFSRDELVAAHEHFIEVAARCAATQGLARMGGAVH